MKRIGLLGLVILLMVTMLPLTTAAAAEYGTVTGGWLRLRSGPSYDSSIIKSYYTGSVVEILGTSGSWYQVKTSDNKTGYMLSTYVKLGGGSGGGTTGTTAYVTSSNGLGVRMRTGPSTGYRVIAVYNVGTQVSVLSTGVIWSRIQVGTTVGYMMSEFLTTMPGPVPTTPPSSDMATVRSSNGYGVRLRSGAGTGYSIIGIYSVGTRVAVITRGTTWDYIQVGSRLGYMMNEFLVYDGSSTGVATGITITPGSATGGQGQTINLNVNVSGSHLSSPAYTLEITKNKDMADIVDGKLYIRGTATIGSEITVKATTKDKNSSGDYLTSSCSVIVIEGTVSNFAFTRTAASVTVAGSNAQLVLNYTVDGPPYITVSVPSAVSSYVTTSVNAATKKVTVNVSSTIPSGTVFVLTGTTNAVGSGGTPLTSSVTISVVTDTTLSSIALVPVSSSLNQGATTDINATLTYANGTIVENADISKYTLAITSGSEYASIPVGSKTLTAGVFSSLNDQTVTVTGTAVSDSTKTATCNIVIAANAVPNAPTLISVIPGDSQVRVNWSAPTGGASVSGYEVFYSTSYDGAKTPFGGVLASDVRTVTVTGLTNGTPYYFWVRAKNATGASAYSSYLTATPAVVVPDAPTGLAVVSYANQSVTVSWVAPTYNGGAAITNYLVYVNGTLAPAADSTVTQRTLTGLTNGSAYSITVKAHNPAGDSVASTALPVTLPTPPAAPTLSAAAGNQKVTLTWNTPATNNSTISGYTVKYWDAASPSTITTVTGVASPYDIASLTNGHTYAAVVIANSNMGDSATSNEASATLPCATAISATDTSGAPDATIDITVTVDGNNLSSPAYTLSVTAGDGEIINGQLHILSTATPTNTITVTATSVNPGSAGTPITATCTVTITSP